MENSPVLILKDHPFRTVSPSRIFTVQDSTLKSDSLGAGRLHGARSCSPLEAGNVSTIPGAGLDPAPLASSHHRTGTVNTSLSSSQECCDNASPPACVTEGQTVRAVCDQAAQTVDSDCECVKTGTPNVEPITNGHVSQEPEQPDCVFPFESRSHLVTTSPVPDWHQTLLDLPRIVKHKPSSITFSDSSCSPGIPEHFAAKESSDDGESSPREEEDGQEDGDEDDDDDVFSELPQSRELHVAYRQRRNSRGRQKRRGAAGGTADAAQMNSGRETSNKEVKSPWSESMRQLMRKLDQLNLDIEEALSASSSPSNTPCITRKKQWGVISKSTANQTSNDDRLQKRVAENGDRLSLEGSSASHGNSAGTKARSKKTSLNKMSNTAGPGSVGLWTSVILELSPSAISVGHNSVI